jgi:outer membrane lipoprotein-sorting protein
LITRWHGFSDLRTLADIRVQRGGEGQQLTGVLLARTPDSVRFEALSPLGQPVLVVSIHQGQLTAYDATANEGLLGPATAETAARLLSLPFDPEDLVGVLAGRVLPPRDLRTAEIQPADAQGPSLDLIGGVHRKRIWMDFETGVVRQVEITGGRYEVRVTYVRDADDRVTGFDLTAAQAYLTGTVRYRNPAFDGGLDPERFRLILPEGAKIERFH